MLLVHQPSAQLLQEVQQTESNLPRSLSTKNSTVLQPEAEVNRLTPPLKQFRAESSTEVNTERTQKRRERKYKEEQARNNQMKWQLALIQHPRTSRQVQEEAEAEVCDHAMLVRLYDQRQGPTSLQTSAVQEFLAAVMLPLSDEQLAEVQQALVQIYNNN
uniref:Uncharacterized protein n=1 Tax=Romanomermis culicivorax TaxID=13658 RepID=A0A915HTG6_ROMCU